MICPKCREETLDRVAPRAGSTIPAADMPYRCHRCEGLWVDLADVQHLVRHEELAHPDEPPPEVAPDLDRRAGVCPQGHGLLGRVRVEVGEGFWLDRCVKCNGVWFDQGEWQMLARQELLHRIPDFWTAAWQRHQRLARQREGYLEWIRSELGDELYGRINELAERLRQHPQRQAAITYLLQESRLRPRDGEAAE